MTSGLLLDVMDVVLAEAPAGLVPAERIPPLRRVASLLPPVLPAGLELRLVSGGSVDLQQKILSQDGYPGIAARHLSDILANEESRAASDWERIERFLWEWSDPATHWQEIVQDLWLEFDLHTNPVPFLPLPAVFMGLACDGIAGEEAPAVLETVLAAILPTPLAPTVRETLDRCATACPERGRITHLGLMLSRPDAGIRLNIAGVPAERMEQYLTAIGWPGSMSRVEALLDRLFPLVDGITLALDIGARVGLRLGLECAIRERPTVARRQTALLDELIALGCCTVAERDALVACRKVIGPPQSRVPWPPALIVGDITRSDARASAISTGLNHVKLDVIEGKPLGAKAYLYFRTRWLEVTTIGAEVADVDESDGHATACATEPVRTPEDAIDAALDFLSITRGQSGLWRDFDDFDGGSDEWVSSVVGSILAEISRPDARREAVSTWRVLTRRVRPDGGWGWNVRVATDADTTSWVIRLAEAIGEGQGDLAFRARRVVEQHVAPGGGLGTYRPIGFPNRSPETVLGWTVAHDCVTALAGGLPGVIGLSARRHLRSSQRTDGSWRPYWWSDSAYATALAAEALAGRGDKSDRPRVTAAIDWAVRRVGPDGSVSAEASGSPSPFTTAWVIRTLALGVRDKNVRKALERASAWLAANQRSDGSWRPSADMWVPPRDTLPDDLPKGAILYFDNRRIFTTGVALSALVMAKRALEEPAGPAGKRVGSGSSAPPSRADARLAAPRP